MRTPQQQAQSDAADGKRSGASVGGVTTEFDVFACDAFSEDTGRWLRMMPDAEFTPT